MYNANGTAKNSLSGQYYWDQGVKKRCRLSWLTKSAFLYEPKCGEKGSGGYGVSATEYSCAHGAQINFGNLTPYLIYGWDTRISNG